MNIAEHTLQALHNHGRWLISLAVVLTGLVGLTGLAHAHGTGDEPLSYVATGLYPSLPSSGVYYEIGRGGTGLTIDFDKTGYAFAIFYSYTESGAPAYYLMQGTYVPSTESERYATGVIGRFSAEPYISINGECVGEGCTYKEPERVMTGLSASIVWTTAHRANMSIGEQTWNLQTGGFVIPDDDLLVGTWSMVVTGQFTIDVPHPLAASGVVQIEKTPDITADMFESKHGAKIPVPGSVIYELSCVSGSAADDVEGNSTYQTCDAVLGLLRAEFDTNRDGKPGPSVWPLRTFMFYEPESGRAGLITAQDVVGTMIVGNILPTNGYIGNYWTGSTYSDLSVDADVIRGRAYSEWQVGTPQLGGDIVLTRLVEGAQRLRRDSGD